MKARDLPVFQAFQISEDEYISGALWQLPDRLRQERNSFST